MKRPPYGFCLQCRLRRVIDGDTPVISLRGSDREWKLRLLDCWAPEKDSAFGKASKAHAEKLLSETKDLAVWIPAPGDPLHILAALTFDRIVAHLYLNATTTLSDEMCKAKMAAPTKAALAEMVKRKGVYDRYANPTQRKGKA